MSEINMILLNNKDIAQTLVNQKIQLSSFIETKAIIELYYNIKISHKKALKIYEEYKEIK